jgi:hypothetical protein
MRRTVLSTFLFVAILGLPRLAIVQRTHPAPSNPLFWHLPRLYGLLRGCPASFSSEEIRGCVVRDGEATSGGTGGLSRRGGSRSTWEKLKKNSERESQKIEIRLKKQNERHHQIVSILAEVRAPKKQSGFGGPRSRPLSM